MKYRFNLDKSSKKFICPGCGKKRFVRFIDSLSDLYCDSQFGRCDRQQSCGYFQHPGKGTLQTPYFYKYEQPESKKPTYIDKQLFERTLLHDYGHENLFNFLVPMFGKRFVNDALQKYFVGLSKKWDLSPIFWQVGLDGNIRSGKIMKYDKAGKRVKQPFNHIAWVHSELKLKEFNLTQCLFGEHLLTDNSKQVILVESEKTALIGSMYYPDYIWLACGGLTGLSGKVKALKGFTVLAIPDKGGYQIWKDELERFGIEVSDEYETDDSLPAGFDFADFVVKERLNKGYIDSKFDVYISEKGYPALWDSV